MDKFYLYQEIANEMIDNLVKAGKSINESDNGWAFDRATSYMNVDCDSWTDQDWDIYSEIELLTIKLRLLKNKMENIY